MLKMRNGTSRSSFRLAHGDNSCALVRTAPGRDVVTTCPFTTPARRPPRRLTWGTTELRFALHGRQRRKSCRQSMASLSPNRDMIVACRSRAKTQGKNPPWSIATGCKPCPPAKGHAKLCLPSFPSRLHQPGHFAKRESVAG